MNKIQKKFFYFVFSFPLVSQDFRYVFVLNIPCFAKLSDVGKNSDVYTKDAHEQA